MNWLDSIIAFFSPRAGAERAAWRASYEEIRNYDAGLGGRLNAGWRVTNQSAEMTDRSHRDTVRARARDLERNSDIANSVTRAYRRNVIGGGFRLQAKTKKTKINNELEKLWRRWCKARNCDVTGTQSLNQMLRMAVQRKKIDGGILIIKVYTRDGMIPLSLQTIEVDELDDSMAIASGKNRIAGGIEYNEWNRPVAYYIQQYAIDGFTTMEPRRVPAKDVMFYYEKKRPSQIREISDMSPTISRIRDTNEFITAVSVKERINACLSVFIKKQLPPTGIGRSGSAVSEGRHNYDGKTLTPGMIKELNAGDEVQVVNPTGQSADATTFTKMQQRLVGAGQGLSYEATSRDMSETNYASARQGMIEDDMTYEEEEEAIIAILDEIYESFVISCVLAGTVQIADFWENKENYLDHEWIKAPKRWIDPAKESTATKTAMQTGQKTFKQIAAENGSDWKTMIDDMVEVQQYGEKKGFDIGGVIFGTNKKSAPGQEEGQGLSSGNEPAGATKPAEEGDGDAKTGNKDSKGKE